MLRTERRGSALWVWLNRPKTRNAINGQLASELCALFAQKPFAHRSVVLSGAGTVFCSGADLNWLATAPAAELGTLHDALVSIRSCGVPVIARVVGTAAGGGAGLVAACDMAFSAGPDVRLALPEGHRGLTPALVSAFVLPKLARVHAARLMLAGEAVDGPTAAAIGLTNAHFADEAAMDAEIVRVCKGVERCSPRSVAVTKRSILARDALLSRDEAVAMLDASRRSPDGAEGIAAFRAKRNPVWPALVPGDL